MKGCAEKYRDLLPEYTLGLLDPEEMKTVTDHLGSCPECAVQLQVIRQYESEAIPEPPPWFWTSLPGKVTAQVDARRKRKMWVQIPVWAGGLAVAAIAGLMLLQPGPVLQSPVDSPDYSVVETAGAFYVGLEEEVLSVSGMLVEDLDQTLGLDMDDVSDAYIATMDLVLDGDGYETMDEETIRIFEDLVEEMTPEGVRKRVIS